MHLFPLLCTLISTPNLFSTEHITCYPNSTLFCYAFSETWGPYHALKLSRDPVPPTFAASLFQCCLHLCSSPTFASRSVLLLIPLPRRSSSFSSPGQLLITASASDLMPRPQRHSQGSEVPSASEHWLQFPVIYLCDYLCGFGIKVWLFH